jgi:antagonist of KipI
MDWASHTLANQLVRNPAEAATLEVTMGGLELAFGGDVRFAVTGAEFQLDLSGRIAPMNRAVDAVGGSVLKFGPRQRGARAYVAVAGGVNVPPVLGSRATHVASHLGGLDGRALQVGDRLPIGSETLTQEDVAHPIAVRMPEGGARVRVLPGPHVHRLPPRSWETLRSSRYVLSPKSDRMGYRLEGQPLPRGSDEELISGATVAGALQVPASGLPILLMADRATTGGYPILAVVISADLPLVGQLAPGDWIEFASCTHDEALDALRKLRHPLGRPAA